VRFLRRGWRLPLHLIEHHKLAKDPLGSGFSLHGPARYWARNTERRTSDPLASVLDRTSPWFCVGPDLPLLLRWLGHSHPLLLCEKAVRLRFDRCPEATLPHLAPEVFSWRLRATAFLAGFRSGSGSGCGFRPHVRLSAGR
jgi:hypothetical protein